MLESVARAEDLVKVHEARLTEKETTSLTPSEVEEYISTLKVFWIHLDFCCFIYPNDNFKNEYIQNSFSICSCSTLKQSWIRKETFWPPWKQSWQRRPTGTARWAVLPTGVTWCWRNTQSTLGCCLTAGDGSRLRFLPGLSQHEPLFSRGFNCHFPVVNWVYFVLNCPDCRTCSCICLTWITTSKLAPPWSSGLMAHGRNRTLCRAPR